MSRTKLSRVWLRASLLVTVMAAAPALLGCAWGPYERIRLGQAPAEYRSVFAEGTTHQTAVGIWHWQRDMRGWTSAVVLLTARDQRVAGKLWATWSPRGETPAYRLVGELSPESLGLGATGPLDVLRVVADELTGDSIDCRAREAHDLVAAGIVRVLRSRPSVDNAGPAEARLIEALERVPADGRADIDVTPAGTLTVEYSASLTR